MRSSVLFAWLVCFIFGNFARGAPPGDKRTILTSGEKVYTLYYQLGQSTVVYFGIRPETVICGNKNYFNIEKLKDGITIQPLSNFSTNLTVMTQGRRYLFFLTPANGSRPDGFVEVKWIPSEQVRPVKSLASLGSATVKSIGQKLKLATDLELVVVSEKNSKADSRRIFELEVRNQGRNTLKTNGIEVVAAVNGNPLDRQVLAWETEDLKGKSIAEGRLIITGYLEKSLGLIVGYQGRSFKFKLNGGKN